MRKKDIVAIHTQPIEQFDASRTDYVDGELVTRDGVLYKLIRPHVIGSTTDWDASDKVRSSRVLSEVTEYYL
jgi:hypothetical protein